MRENRIPDFFLVGAARAGTTSLWAWFLDHPSVFVPPDLIDKEPAFFCDNWGVKEREDYQNLFAGAAPNQMIGDCSTAYLSAPESPSKIFEAAPEAKILISIRNPITRALSLYRWMTTNGFEPAFSFERALQLEAQRSKNQDFPSIGYRGNFEYLESGKYSQQIARYQKQFRKENILIFRMEDIFREPERLKNDINNLIGVESYRADFPRENSCGIPLIPAVQHRVRLLLNRYRGYAPAAFILRALMKANSIAGNLRSSEMSQELHAALLDQYRTDIEETAEITGLDLSEWLSRSC